MISKISSFPYNIPAMIMTLPMHRKIHQYNDPNIIKSAIEKIYNNKL